MSIKTAVKFTNLKELEVERDHLAEESIRLRLALEEEQSKRVVHRRYIRSYLAISWEYLLLNTGLNISPKRTHN